MPSSINNDCVVDGMIVDTKRLDEILLALSATIKEQNQEISKISHLEELHSRLKRDVQYLELKVSSNQITEAVECYLQKDSDNQDESKNEALTNSSSESKYLEISDHVSLRRQKVVHERLSHIHKASEEANLWKIRREVVGLKAIMGQLQDDFNMELANSMDFVKQLDSMKCKIVDIDKCIGSTSSTLNIIEMKRSLSETYETLLRSLKEVESRITGEMDSRVDIEATKLQKSFEELSESLKNRMLLWDSKLASFANKCDLNALIENVDEENIQMQNRLEFLEKGTLQNQQSILDMKHQAALVTMNKCYLIWKRRVQLLTWSKWQQFMKWDMEEKAKVIKRKRKIRQLLIRHWYSRKKKAWQKWQLFLHWHRRIEGLKCQALKLIINRMEAVRIMPMRNAFNRLRRYTITERIVTERKMDSNEGLIINKSARSTCQNGLQLKNDECLFTSMQSNHYDFAELLHTFRNDKDGAIYTLAQEVNNLRVYDINKLHKDMLQGDRMLNENLHQSLSEEVCSLETKIKSLGKKVDDNYQCLSTQLPEIKRHISELRNSLHGTINRVKIIEQTHRDRIELLCESKEASDEKICDLESNLEQAQVKIRGLEYNYDRSQNLVNTMLEKMNHFEQNQIKERQQVVNELSALQMELMRVNSKVKDGEEVRKVLDDNLNATKHELIQTKIAMKNSFDHVNRIFDSHGIRKPTPKVIIEDGVLYEQIAKEKNYVVQLNSVSDGKNEVDVASHIAAFAHDYAAWISFQADHEALQLVVVGNNPEDAIYIEDEMEARRSNLLRNFKEELVASLNQAYPDAGTVRLEARSRFIARVVDAIEAALSKHDQVFIPASTRLGRVRATVPTCVACDRPLTTRGKRSSEIEKADATTTETKPPSRPPPSSASYANNYIKPFVMRGGFRMPST